MASHGEITLRWGDGEHTFNIAKIGHLLELEDKCAAGVSEIFGRLRTQRWRYNDVRETVRLGLIGGGKSPGEASKLVERYVDGRPWSESYTAAVSVLLAAMTGPPEDPLTKKREAEGTATEDQTASSAPPSTASEPLSDSLPAT